MNEITEIEQIKLKSGELTDIEQQLILNNGYTIKQPINDVNKDECKISIFDDNEIQKVNTLEFLQLCDMSISSFKKDKTNKIKLINKKYKLFQYNFNIDSFIYIGKYATLKDISIFLDEHGCTISIKKLIIQKLFKVEIN